MNTHKIFPLLFLVFILGNFSCSSGGGSLEKLLVGKLDTTVNPYEKAPLAAELIFNTKEKCSVEITVEGSIPVTRKFKNGTRNHKIPVIGLYPDTLNLVKIVLSTEDGKEYHGEVEIQTEALPHFFPDIKIVKVEKENMEPGFHLVEQLIANNGKFHTYTIMFDDEGHVRWFLDMSSVGQITYTSYRMENGNWLYLSWIDMFEMSDLGEVIKKDQLWGFAGDHDLIVLENGKVLMGGSKKDAKIIKGRNQYNSRFDFVVEWDRSQNKSSRSWDLREVLDVDRGVYPADYSLDFNSDWFHINSIDYNEKDKSLVVSGRNQGVLKINEDNSLKWILAPRKSWGKAGWDGNGISLSPYLLKAIDASGNPYPADVQEGDAGTDDFEWSTGQHSARRLENGNVLMFDNGLMRNFKKDLTYSRAVEYKIDEENMTIQQVWQYGKERGLDMYSAITSGVNVLPVTGNRLITAGNVRRGSLPPHASITEVTYPDSKEVFEAHIYFKDAMGTKAQEWAQFDLAYRGNRYPLIFTK